MKEKQANATTRTISFLADALLPTNTEEGGGGGWKDFEVIHSGGIHVLQMCYASPKISRPCRLRINGQEMFISVALGVTSSDSDDDDNEEAVWFDDEGTFDLGQDQTRTIVGFKPVSSSGTFPRITEFRFVPETTITSLGGISRDVVQNLPQYSSSGGAVPPNNAAVTFSFEIGISSQQLQEQEEQESVVVEYLATFLPGTAIKFRFGEAHDSITIDGDPLGTQHGGDSFPRVTFYETDDIIASVTLGLSTFAGEAAFHGLVLLNKHRNNKNSHNRQGKSCRPSSKRPLVGAQLVEPTWTFDYRKLGLNIWITSIAAPKHKQVARYGFTLSSNPHLEFNREEFLEFWNWLVHIKHKMSKETNEFSPEQVKDVMERQCKFLLHAFSNAHQYSNAPSPSSRTILTPSTEGYLYGSRRHVSIIYDVFSIYIYRLPDGETFKSTLFVDGKQFNSKLVSSMQEIRFMTRDDVYGVALAAALQDTDLLVQMGLMKPVNPHSKIEFELDEVELLPLEQDDTIFSGNYQPTGMARRVICLLALAGLRKISCDIVMVDNEGWDIYDIAAGASCQGVYKTSRKVVIETGALSCGLLQMLVPVLLIYRGLEEETGSITYDVYFFRLLFAIYAIIYEVKKWGVAQSDRVSWWLCFLPEFDDGKLLAGLLVNKICQLVVASAIVILMIRSFTVFDVTLNALALYFILDVDDELVDDRTLEDLMVYQRKQLFILKAKTALEYSLPGFDDRALPDLKELPAHYVRKASHNVSTVSITLLSLGSIWMIAEPWVLGWAFTKQ